MTLNRYIIENADKVQDSSFLQEFDQTEVFFTILESNKPLPNGPMQASEDTSLRIQTADLDIGKMVIYYTNKSDDRLSKEFGGMPLNRALKMVQEMRDVDGILLQSDEDAWFSADKQAINNVLRSVSA
jgi:ribosome-binding ATPase YchF (GTP1/OBG family)